MEEKRQDALEMEKETDKRSQKIGKEIERKSNIMRKKAQWSMDRKVLLSYLIKKYDMGAWGNQVSSRAPVISGVGMINDGRSE